MKHLLQRRVGDGRIVHMNKSRQARTLRKADKKGKYQGSKEGVAQTWKCKHNETRQKECGQLTHGQLCEKTLIEDEKDLTQIISRLFKIWR